MNKFTQGEWYTKQASNCGDSLLLIREQADQTHLQVNTAADAHLISAAPDMYRALREIVSNSSIQANFPHECEVAEAALAKADGEV